MQAHQKQSLEQQGQWQAVEQAVDTAVLVLVAVEQVRLVVQVLAAVVQAPLAAVVQAVRLGQTLGLEWLRLVHPKICPLRFQNRQDSDSL